jgi:hypothetical protein
VKRLFERRTLSFAPPSFTFFYVRKKFQGIEPRTFGVAVGDENHCTIQTAFASEELKF